MDNALVVRESAKFDPSVVSAPSEIVSKSA
jgi:hypothetical protein